MILPGLRCFWARVLVEPLNGARPCLLGRDLVIAFRRGVIDEAMQGIRIDGALAADVVFLQPRSLRGIGPRQRLIEPAMVYEDSGLDLGHIFRLGRAAIEWCSRSQ